MSLGADRKTFRNEELILQVSTNVDPSVWDESKYEAFLDELCGHREYQKTAIRTALRFLLGTKYATSRDLAKSSFSTNEVLKQRWGRWENFERQLQLPEKLACSLDLATGTGKSYVLYGISAILLAEEAVDRVLVLCPSNTIELGLLAKFKELATNATLKDLLPVDSRAGSPRVITANETIGEGSICVENYHAILENTKSSIRDSLRGVGKRVAVLNDEAHHVANETGANSKKWKEFLLNDEYGFKYIVGVSGTCYVSDDYFSDVVFRYSLRQAIEERFVKKVEYVAEMPRTNSADEKWQLVWNRHQDLKKKLASRGIRPISIVVTKDIATCKRVVDELANWMAEWAKIPLEVTERKVLAVSSAKEHQANLARLRTVDSAASDVEWIVSVSMLSEGWDVKNVFQIVPHEERAFNSKLLIAQVLGRGLRRPDDWTGEDPVVTVFNHDAWSGRIKYLVNEILEIERRLTSSVIARSKFNFELHNLDYSRDEEVTEHTRTGEYKFYENGFVVLPTQVEDESVTIDFERAVTGDHVKFNTTLQHKTFSVEEVAERIYNALRAIDEENSQMENLDEHTNYAKRCPLEKCEEIVKESLKRANITSGRVTDENRQRILQAIGPLRRRSTKRVVYTLNPNALLGFSTGDRQAESCSAAEIRRASKTVFYTEGCAETLPDEQQEFFLEVDDPDGEFRAGREVIENPANFKAPLNMAIADATPERRFVRGLCEARNARELDAWIKNVHVGFYSLEYAWKKGDHPKRGQFSPDFFIKQGEFIFVIEVKDDSEVTDPAPENIKKHEYARAHFQNLNTWLIRDNLNSTYQFNMLTPRDFNGFFQKLRERDLAGYRSEVDVAMINAGSKSASEVTG